MHEEFWSSEEYDEQAHSLYNEGDFDGALETLKEGLSRFPDAVELMVGMGYARLAREEVAWAGAAFRRALSMDPTHEDAMVGMGEVLLRTGDRDGALDLFRRVQQLGFQDDVELMLTMGRALYREGLLAYSLDVFLRLAAARPEVGDAMAGAAYCLHRMGDEVRAARYLRRALRVDPSLHDVRVYLGHLLYDRGEWDAALDQFELVPPSEHWDPLGVWRLIELKRSLRRGDDQDLGILPWRRRLRELEVVEDDPVERLLAEVESRFAPESDWPLKDELQLELFHTEPPAEAPPRGLAGTVQVRTAGGRVFRGGWEEVVRCLRDSAGLPAEPIPRAVRRLARRWRDEYGVEIAPLDAETLIRGAASAGILALEILR